MFQRRELVRDITIPAKHVQRNIVSSFLSQIKASVEGRAGTEGFVQPGSSVVLDYSLGNLDLLKSGVRYRVRFQADICFPHKGQTLKVQATFKSKIGLHAEAPPLRVLLPRDLHIGNAEYESIQEKDEIEFEVLGVEFKQGDEHIFVLGRLLTRIAAPVAPPPAVIVAPVEVPVSSEESTKSVVFAPTPSEEKKEPVRRKRRLGASNALQLNVGNGVEGTN